MSKSREVDDRALAAQDRLRKRLRSLAASPDDALSEEVGRVRESLDEYDALLSEQGTDALGWPTDARERIARCRVELKRLVTREARRTDVVGMVRLVIPQCHGREGEDRGGG